jgi:hypothetical protein
MDTLTLIDKWAPHLKERHIDLDKVPMMLGDEHIYFWIYNLVGQIIGYQKYTPFAPKSRNNEGRYITIVPSKQYAFIGMHSFYDSEVLFTVEGVFDATRLWNLGLSCLAILGTADKAQINFLRLQKKAGRKVIHITDPGLPATMLKNLRKFTSSIIIPSGDEDLGDMSDDVVKSVLNEYIKRK